MDHSFWDTFATIQRGLLIQLHPLGIYGVICEPYYTIKPCFLRGFDAPKKNSPLLLEGIMAVREKQTAKLTPHKKFRKEEKKKRILP